LHSVCPALNRDRRALRVWRATAPHPANGISHARIAERLTRENWLQKAAVRQGPTSIYYIYILYAGVSPEEGPWMVEVHGNDVNWEYHPLTDDFSQEFANLDDALRYANGEDDSYFAERTVPARRSCWPRERPAESYVVFEFGSCRPSQDEPGSTKRRR
jgi:hypothetical protein